MDGDGVCDEFEIAGCQDATACNYNADATDSDDSCTYADAGYDYDGNCLTDTDGDGVCDEFEDRGLPGRTACNYNADALIATTHVRTLTLVTTATQLLKIRTATV